MHHDNAGKRVGHRQALLVADLYVAESLMLFVTTDKGMRYGYTLEKKGRWSRPSTPENLVHIPDQRDTL